MLNSTKLPALIVREFQDYRNSVGEYASSKGISNPIRWWNARLTCAALARVAVKLAYLTASTANIERCFSSIKHIQGDCKSNMKPETLIRLSQLRLANYSFVQDEELSFEKHMLESYDDETDSDIDDDSFSSSFSSNQNNIDLPDYDDLNDWIGDDNELREWYKLFTQYIDFSIEGSPRKLELSQKKDISDIEIQETIKQTLAIASQNGSDICTEILSQGHAIEEPIVP